MIKIIFATTVALTATLIANAQYYYKDIVTNKELLVEMAQLKEHKIKTISIKSYEDNGSPSDGFFCEKSLSKNYTKAEMRTKSNVTGAAILTSVFTSDGLLAKTIDSSEISVSTSIYNYDEENRVKSILSSVHSSDDDFASKIFEQHIYEYDAKGLLSKMIHIKNNTDSSTILFSVDEKNNVTIEKDTKSGNTYYYYYDSKNRLTDVVRLNQFNQKMLPDYIFEYNSAGLISQMTVTEEGGSYYFIWKYIYDNGLRIKEKCFSKEKRLMGTIEYEYN